MNPLRWDVLLVGFVLAVPVLALGLRGDLSPEDMMNRVLWCLGAGWAVVAVFRVATTPPPPARKSKTVHEAVPEPAETGDPSPAV